MWITGQTINKNWKYWCGWKAGPIRSPNYLRNSYNETTISAFDRFDMNTNRDLSWSAGEHGGGQARWSLVELSCVWRIASLLYRTFCWILPPFPNPVLSRNSVHFPSSSPWWRLYVITTGSTGTMDFCVRYGLMSGISVFLTDKQTSLTANNRTRRDVFLEKRCLLGPTGLLDYYKYGSIEIFFQGNEDCFNK